MTTREPDADAGVEPETTLTVDGAGRVGAAIALGPGSRVGRHLLGEQLGVGGMGVVYRAHDPMLDREVAVKVVHAQRGAASGKARLLREAQAMAKLRHPNVVPIFDVGEIGDDVFVVMPLLAGGTLGAWMRGGPRPWRQVLERYVAAGRGLAAAHAAGLIHRDFKPDNVLLGAAGEVQVADFGLARVEGVAGTPPRDDDAPIDLTRTGDVLGTPAYMAPEQLLGGNLDARADQFGFCVALWEGLFGTRPFATDQLRGAAAMSTLFEAIESNQVVTPPSDRDVPGWLRAAVLRGLRAAPEERWPSMDALIEQLRPPRRRAPLVGAGVLVTGAAIAALLWARRSTPPAVAPGPSCDDEAAAIDAVWNDDARAAYLAAPGDADFAAEDVRWFDDVATRWKASRQVVCRERDLDATRRARAVTCLDDARAALVTALTRDERASWPEIRDPGACEDGIEIARPTLRDAVTGFGNVGLTAVSSPDGARVAYATSEAERGVFDVATGVPVPTALPRMTLVRAWSADGRWLVGADDRRGLRVDIESGREEPLLYSQTLSPLPSITVRRDGAALLFVRRDSGVEVARCELPGGAIGREWEEWIAWEPDGHRAALVLPDGTGSRLMVIDLRTGAVAEVRLRLYGQWSPIGVTWMAPGVLATVGAANRGTRSTIWRLELDDGGTLATFPRALASLGDRDYGQLLAAPPGHLVLTIGAMVGRLRRLDRGEQTDLPGITMGKALAADARTGHVLVQTPDRLIVIDRDGQPVVATAVADAFGLHHGTLISAPGSATGKQVELFAAGAPAGAPLALAIPAGPKPRVYCNTWRPDRCVVVHEEVSSLQVASLGPEGPGRFHRFAGRNASIDVSADGRRAAVVTAPAHGTHAVIIDLETGAEQSADVPGFEVRQLKWARDDVSLYYSGANLDGPSFQIRHTTNAPGAQPRVVLDTGTTWLSSFVVLGDDLLVYAVMEFPTRISILDLPDVAPTAHP